MLLLIFPRQIGLSDEEKGGAALDLLDGTVIKRLESCLGRKRRIACVVSRVLQTLPQVLNLRFQFPLIVG